MKNSFIGTRIRGRNQNRNELKVLKYCKAMKYDEIEEQLKSTYK